MILENLTNNTLLAGIAITLIHFLWQGVLVALILKLLLSFISSQKSQTRYALTATAMLINLVLPLITFAIIYDIEYRQASSLIQSLPLLEYRLYQEQIPINSWYSEWFQYLPSITIFWFSIVILLTSKLLFELYNVNKLPHRETISADDQLQERFEQLIEKVGLSNNVKLLLSNKIHIPMAIGYLKPVVLIPFSMISGLTPQQLDMLLLHELAHIRRHDYLVNFLQTLVETFLFFHPAVRWTSKQMRNEREYCSDDIAVQHGGCALAYAHTLADTASLCRKHRHNTTPSMAMAASGGDLKQRVVRLLDNQPHCSQNTDGGKWIASFAILVTISFAISQYLLTLPVIDYQPSNRHLNYSESSQDHSFLSKTPLVTEKSNSNSFKQLLLSKNLVNNTDKTDIAAKEQLLNIKKKVLTIDKITEVNQQKKSAPKSISIIKSTSHKSVNDELLTIKSAPQKQNFTHNEAIINQLVVQEKSISDLAFERTDSKRNSSLRANSYSEKISTLFNKPSSFNASLNTNKQTRFQTLKEPQSSSNSYDSLPQAFDGYDKINQATFNYSYNEKTTKQPTHHVAKLIKSIAPKYPSSAKRDDIELEVRVEFVIDKNGLVKNIQFQSDNMVGYFRNAIRKAMRKWQFIPAHKNGLAVESKMSKIFSFSLIN